MRGSRILLLIMLVFVAVLFVNELKKARQTSQGLTAVREVLRPEVGAGESPRASVPSQDEGQRSSAPSPSAPQAPSSAPESEPQGPLPGSQLADCLKSGRPTVADFGRGWCQPCKMMEPVLKQAARDYRGNANIVFVDLDEYADLGRRYRVAVMPTQIVFNAKGEEISRHTGYMGSEEITRRLAALGVQR